MATRRGGKAVRPDDGRLAANRPAPRRPPAPKTRQQLLMAGELDVSDLTDKEIMMGRCADKNGTFTGRPPNTYPRQLHDALRKEFTKRMNSKWQAASDVAFNVMLEIATNPRASADARFKAAQYITERTQGKIPDKIEQTVELKPYQEDIESLFVDVGAQDDNVISFTKGKRNAG